MTAVKVTSSAELLDALAAADHIEVDGSLTGMPMITLRPGVTLRGGTLRFGAKGVRLTSDNLLERGRARRIVHESTSPELSLRLYGSSLRLIQFAASRRAILTA
jgi:hypothetical protein